MAHRIKLNSNITAKMGISIGQGQMTGVDGMEGVQTQQIQQLPPELIQKIRETLAIGISRSLINRALKELQPQEEDAI